MTQQFSDLTTITHSSQHNLNELSMAGNILLEKTEHSADGVYCGTYYTFRNLDGSFIHTFYSTAGFGLQSDVVKLHSPCYIR